MDLAICCIIIGAHRALPDIEAMERVFTHPTLASCLSWLTVRRPQQQVNLWVNQKRLHFRASSLIKSLGGKPAVTDAQAKRLDSLGLSFDDLVKLYSESTGIDDFCSVLKARGVNSKPLREKLVKCLRTLGVKCRQPSTNS